MKYKIILSQRGKEIYKGGNIEVLKPLINKTFEIRNYKVKSQGFNVAENVLYKMVMETLGSASFNLYIIEEVKK